MPRTSDPAKIRARHDEIVMYLDITRTAILGAINRLHPRAAACLPLPELELPALEGSRTEPGDDTPPLDLGLSGDPYATVTDKLYRNLFTPEGDRHPQWRANHPDVCPHMPHPSVLAVFELVHKWYALVSDARSYRDAASKRGAFERGLSLVQYHLNELNALPAALTTGTPPHTVYIAESLDYSDNVVDGRERIAVSGTLDGALTSLRNHEIHGGDLVVTPSPEAQIGTDDARTWAVHERGSDPDEGSEAFLVITAEPVLFPRGYVPPAAAELLAAVGEDDAELAANLSMEGTFSPDQVAYAASVLMTETADPRALDGRRTGLCPDCGEDLEPVVEDEPKPGEYRGLRLWAAAQHLMVDSMVAVGCEGTEVFPRWVLTTTSSVMATD